MVQPPGGAKAGVETTDGAVLVFLVVFIDRGYTAFHSGPLPSHPILLGDVLTVSIVESSTRWAKIPADDNQKKNDGTNNHHPL